MISVHPQPEYPVFDQEVRQPGLGFLARNPKPTGKMWKKNRFWSCALEHLGDAYENRCAYTTLQMTGKDKSVDHFLPKDRCPRLAFEWSNFRLARKKVNGFKNNEIGIVDPFDMQNDWFVLHFDDFWIRPAEDVENAIKSKIQRTIEVLQLNSEEFIDERVGLIRDLRDEHITLDFLDDYYPFISNQIRDQDYQGRLESINV